VSECVSECVCGCMCVCVYGPSAECCLEGELESRVFQVGAVGPYGDCCLMGGETVTEHWLRVLENTCIVLRRIFGPNRGLEKTTLRGALWSVRLTKYYSGDQTEKNDMGGTCSTYGEEMCIQGFCGEP